MAAEPCPTETMVASCLSSGSSWVGLPLAKVEPCDGKREYLWRRAIRAGHGASGAMLSVQSLPAPPQVLLKRWKLSTACLALVALGVAVGMLVEKWDCVTALYVVVQIITTVGYGDVTVKSEPMRMFMACYVLLCLLVVANGLNLVTSHIVERNSEMLRQRLERLEFGQARTTAADRGQAWELRGCAPATVLFTAALACGVTVFKFVEPCECPAGSLCDPSTQEACAMTGGIELSWVQAFYMAVVTMTTVGFGDYTPKSSLGRLFAVFWMVVGVAATGFFISQVSSMIAGGQEELEEAEDISKELFGEMDRDHNGFLTKAEYTRFVLLKHGLVSQAIVDDLDRNYDAMDTGLTGQVTWSMVEAAKHRRKLPANDQGQRSMNSDSDYSQIAQHEAGHAC